MLDTMPWIKELRKIGLYCEISCLSGWELGSVCCLLWLQVSELKFPLVFLVLSPLLSLDFPRDFLNKV